MVPCAVAGDAGGADLLGAVALSFEAAKESLAIPTLGSMRASSGMIHPDRSLQHTK